MVVSRLTREHLCLYYSTFINQYIITLCITEFEVNPGYYIYVCKREKESKWT